MFSYERNLYEKGINLIAGVDEVGRGALAGPMVVAAVVFSRSDLARFNDVRGRKNPYLQIDDSKRLSKKKREELDIFIRDNCLCYNIFELSNTEIDKNGISVCTQIGFGSVIKNLEVEPEHILTDAFRIKALPREIQTNIIKGDQMSVNIAAASIIAKVYRDNLMHQMHEVYPVYGFDHHVGYGTKQHRDMITKHGYCDIHRKSFRCKFSP